MKTKANLKRHLISAVIVIIAIMYITPIQAQVKRDHHTEKKEIKKRDHRTTNQAKVNSDVIYFDEGDAIFGTRVELQRKYPGLKFTEKIEQIIITKKLSEGENLIHKTESGTTIYAIVNKGKITSLSSSTPKIKDIKDGTSNTIVYKDNNKTCFKCTEICHEPEGVGEPICWSTCVIIDCSKPHTAEIPGKIVKGH